MHLVTSSDANCLTLRPSKADTLCWKGFLSQPQGAGKETRWTVEHRNRLKLENTGDIERLICLFPEMPPYPGLNKHSYLLRSGDFVDVPVEIEDEPEAEI